MKGLTAAVLATLCFTSLAIAGDDPPQNAAPMTPMQAIERAADAAPLGVRGTFEITVQATGNDGATIYLNSERDYRDRRCLTIAIPRGLIPALKKKFGDTPGVFFEGKQVRVAGFARQIKIGFTHHGRQTGSYYFQTHVSLESADDIEVVPAATEPTAATE